MPLPIRLTLGVASLALLAGCAQPGTQFAAGPTQTVADKVRADVNTRIAGVTLATERLGGKARIVVPDAARLRPFAVQMFTDRKVSYPSGSAVDTAVTAFRELIDGDVEALRRAKLFDTIDVVTQNDTTNPEIGDADHLLFYQVRTLGPNFTGRWIALWLMRRQGDVKVERVALDPGAPANERLNLLVKATQVAAQRLKEGKGQDPSMADGGGGRSSATAFAVGAGGHLVTNNHAVANCTTVTASRTGQKEEKLAIVSRDAANDLALLKADKPLAATATLRDGLVRQGDNVVAVGYPLGTILSSDTTVTTGTVSALSGLRDDSRFLQFSAPVQAGNSGGPLIDAAGNVAGIVTSKINALAIAMATGDIPQNVNFALKSTVIRGFLDSNGVTYQHGNAAANRDFQAPEIADKARAYTWRITCE